MDEQEAVKELISNLDRIASALEELLQMIREERDAPTN